MNDSLILSKIHLIDLFFIKFDNFFKIFIKIFIKFNKIILAVVNEERRILSIDFNIVILIYRNNKDKDKFTKSANDNNNRETYFSYKATNRKYRYFFVK